MPTGQWWLGGGAWLCGAAPPSCGKLRGGKAGDLLPNNLGLGHPPPRLFLSGAPEQSDSQNQFGWCADKSCQALAPAFSWVQRRALKPG